MLGHTKKRDGVWLWTCVLLLCGGMLVAASVERESQLAQAPFIMGSRFGRSPPRLLMPRNDKFFFSSRYGKRSPPAPNGPPPAPPAPLASLARPELLCDYTGMQSLYRCRPSSHYVDNRRLEDSSSEDN